MGITKEIFNKQPLWKVFEISFENKENKRLFNKHQILKRRNGYLLTKMEVVLEKVLQSFLQDFV